MERGFGLTIWLSLPVYCHRLILPALVWQAVDLRPARRLAAFWQGQGVQVPSDLSAWLHRREDMGQRAEVPAAFGHFAALAQDQMLALTLVDQLTNQLISFSRILTVVKQHFILKLSLLTCGQTTAKRFTPNLGLQINSFVQKILFTVKVLFCFEGLARAKYRIPTY